MFRPTQGHPQANKERTRNNKMSTQWDPISILVELLGIREESVILYLWGMNPLA
jgi:hypothetical protein